MLKLALVAMFALSLGTLSFASSMIESPSDGVAAAAPHAWIQTYE